MFGSYIRGNFRLDSDIDILVISDIYGDNPHGYDIK
ncbi:nucleotidyltransferase domain-containing protein [Caldivirga sp.]